MPTSNPTPDVVLCNAKKRLVSTDIVNSIAINNKAGIVLLTDNPTNSTETHGGGSAKQMAVVIPGFWVAGSG